MKLKVKYAAHLYSCLYSYFMKQNEQQRNLKDLTKREEKFEQFK